MAGFTLTIFSSFFICEEPSSHYPQCICLPVPAPPYVTRLSPLGTLAKTSALIKNTKTLFPLILLSWEQICDGGSLLGERLGRRRHRKICFLVYSVSFIGDCFMLSALFYLCRKTCMKWTNIRILIFVLPVYLAVWSCLGENLGS